MRLGDALALTGHPDSAAAVYLKAIDALSPYARNWRVLLRLRAMTARNPTIIGELVSADDSKSRIEQLLSIPDTTGAATVWAALASAEAEDFTRAADLLNGAADTEAASTLGQRWDAWIAAFSFRGGRLEDAERFLRSAVRKAVADDDKYEVERLEVFRQRIKWTAESEST